MVQCPEIQEVTLWWLETVFPTHCAIIEGVCCNNPRTLGSQKKSGRADSFLSTFLSDYALFTILSVYIPGMRDQERDAWIQ